MPYIIPLDRRCEFRGCHFRATQQVVNDAEVSLGDYCARHAGVKLREYEAAIARTRATAAASRVDVDDAWRAP